MDFKAFLERSPSFLSPQLQNRCISIETKSSTKRIPVAQRATDIEFLSYILPPSSIRKMAANELTKKPKCIPKRAAELIDDIETESCTKKNNVRKQLWSVGKNEKRRGTIMKPKKETIRKSIYYRPTATKKENIKVNIADETLPLVDLEKYEKNPNKLQLKRSLFVVPQPIKPNLTSNQRPTSSNIRFIKPPTKSIPKLVEQSNTSNSAEDSEKPSYIEEILRQLAVIVEKLNSLEELKQLISENFECENCGHKQSIKPNEKQLKSSTSTLETNLNKESSIVNLLPMKNNVSKQEITSFSDTKDKKTPVAENLNLSLTPKRENSFSLLEPNHLMSTPIVENQAKEQEYSKTILESPLKIDSRLSQEDAETENLIDTKSEIIPSLKSHLNEEKPVKMKSSISQFEFLESKFKNDSGLSLQLNLSDSESPKFPIDIERLINDDEGAEKNLNPLFKSLSASSIDGLESKNKSVVKTKSHSDVHSESMYSYNQIRDDVKFLCTPIVRKTNNLMTPGAKNNQRKIISRRVQEQLLLLSDNNDA